MTQDYFDNSHVLNIGEQGSLGPAVGPWEMIVQNFRQQFLVDSELAFQSELQNRWVENLARLRAAGQNFSEPTYYPTYTRYAQFIREGARPALENVNAREMYGLNPERDFDDMQRADETIRRLNNPQIKTFRQILDEVSEMQRSVEEETASMSERAGTFANIAGFAGTMAGSFTLRDPLNVFTAPVGVGRTIATRIASDMVVAGATTAITEYTAVVPNRALAGLPERDPLLNIAAATIGAGVFRAGIIEPAAYGLRRLRGAVEPEIDFDLRDAQLQQMFADNSHSPSARGAASLLNDTIFIERNNPYGEGYAATERFVAELRAVQRSMNGEPMTAVGRVLPPVPVESLRKAADFEIVREQVPDVHARLEEARTRVAELNEAIEQQAAARTRAFESVSESKLDEKYQALFDALEQQGKNDDWGVAIREALTAAGIGKILQEDILAARVTGKISSPNDLKAFLEARGRSLVSPDKKEVGVDVNTLAMQLSPEMIKQVGAKLSTNTNARLDPPQIEAFIKAGMSEAAARGELSPELSAAILARFNGKPLVPLKAQPKVKAKADDVFEQAVQIVTESGVASTSGLQKQLGLGYNEAARLMERLEKEGIVSAPNQAGVREVLRASSAAPETDAQLKKQLRIANQEYQKAYQAVEAEGARLREQQAAAEAAQQSEASNILAQVSEGRPFLGPLLRYDNVGSLVDRINAFNDTLDEAAVARFIKEAAGEGEAPTVTWLREDGRIDIGLKEPVDPDFRLLTDEGETSIIDIMRDLQDDVDLVDAVRSCSI